MPWRFGGPTKSTLPETDIGPENGWLEEYTFLFGKPIFRGYITGWWLNQPFWKKISQIGSFPQGSGWKWKIFELLPRSWFLFQAWVVSRILEWHLLTASNGTFHHVQRSNFSAPKFQLVGFPLLELFGLPNFQVGNSRHTKRMFSGEDKTA